MSAAIPIILSTILYTWTAIAFAMKGDKQHTIIFVGYAVANLGFIWLAFLPPKH